MASPPAKGKIPLTIYGNYIYYNMYDLLFYSISLLFSALSIKVQHLQQDREVEAVDPVAAEFLFAEGAAASEPRFPIASFSTSAFSSPPVAETPPRTPLEPYELGPGLNMSKRLLNDRESIFFQALVRDLARVGCTAMAKVNLADVVNGRDLAADERSELKLASGKMGRRHVDFVVCEGAGLCIVAAVRLRPASVLRPLHDVMARKVDRAVAASGVPVVRIDASGSYAEGEVLAQVAPYLTA